MSLDFKGGRAPAKPRTVRIFLKGPLSLRNTEMGQKFEPTVRASTKCSCAATLHFYTTYPNEKSMPFDRDPVVLDQMVREDGAVIATVSADDTHFNSCRDLKDARTKEKPTHGFTSPTAR